MNSLQGMESIRLVKVGPSLRERLERRVAAEHHRAVIARLRGFREHLERDMEPEPWTLLEAPMVLLMSDLCAALGLNEAERTEVLGQAGETALADVLEERPLPIARPPALLNERQAKALDHVQGHGAINLGAFRQICPNWSPETLRCDLADLVSRGLLVKNGHKKGTYYTPVLRQGGRK